MNFQSLPHGRRTFVDACGNPLAGGAVSYFAPGTNDAAMVYADVAGQSRLNNPIVLDAAGGCTVYGIGAFREVVSDAFGNVLSDRVTSTGPVSADMAQVVTMTIAEAANSLGVAVNARLYGAVGDGAHDDSDAIQNALSAAGNAGGGYVYLPPSGSAYRLSRGLILPAGVTLCGGATLTIQANPALTTGGNGCAVHGLTINSTGTTGFAVVATADSRFVDLTVSAASGLSVSTGATVYLSRPRFSRPSGTSGLFYAGAITMPVLTWMPYSAVGQFAQTGSGNYADFSLPGGLDPIASGCRQIRLYGHLNVTTAASSGNALVRVANFAEIAVGFSIPTVGLTAFDSNWLDITSDAANVGTIQLALPPGSAAQNAELTVVCR